MEPPFEMIKRRDPSELDDFDVHFRLDRLVRRRDDRRGNGIWTPARWQNALWVGLSGALLFAGYVMPVLRWEEVRQHSTLSLAVGGFVLAVLLGPLLVMLGAGLFHWPRLVVDRRGRFLSVRRRFARSADAGIHLDEIERLATTTLLVRIDGTIGEIGGHASGGVIDVLYAELVDGRLACIASSPSRALRQELARLL